MADRSASQFYDELAADYHLLFPDWEQSIHRQAAALHGVIGRYLGATSSRVLDCACGIGTQAIGLALRGYQVAGTDISARAVTRAAQEARKRDLSIVLAAADMRALPFRNEIFDVLVCADNAITHLLERDEILRALSEMRRVARHDGLLLLGVRPDDARVVRANTSPPQICETPQGTVITVQLRTWHDDDRFDMDHIQLHPKGDSWEVRVRRTKMWAISHAELAELAVLAGFSNITWHGPDETGFFQPLMAATAS